MQAEPPVPTHRRLWMAAQATAGFLVVLTGLLIGVYGNWGPPWPTEPSFAPGVPASGSPLDVTFNGTNTSVLFPVPGLFVNCEMVCLRASNSSRQPLKSGLRHVYVLAMGITHLAPGQTMPFRCPLRGHFGLRDQAKAMRTYLIGSQTHKLFSTATISIFGQFGFRGTRPSATDSA